MNQAEALLELYETVGNQLAQAYRFAAQGAVEAASRQVKLADITAAGHSEVTVDHKAILGALPKRMTTASCHTQRAIEVVLAAERFVDTASQELRDQLPPEILNPTLTLDLKFSQQKLGLAKYAGEIYSRRDGAAGSKIYSMIVGGCAAVATQQTSTKDGRHKVHTSAQVLAAQLDAWAAATSATEPLLDAAKFFGPTLSSDDDNSGHIDRIVNIAKQIRGTTDPDEIKTLLANLVCHPALNLNQELFHPLHAAATKERSRHGGPDIPQIPLMTSLVRPALQLMSTQHSDQADHTAIQNIRIRTQIVDIRNVAQLAKSILPANGWYLNAQAFCGFAAYQTVASPNNFRDLLNAAQQPISWLNAVANLIEHSDEPSIVKFRDQQPTLLSMPRRIADKVQLLVDSADFQSPSSCEILRRELAILAGTGPQSLSFFAERLVDHACVFLSENIAEQVPHVSWTLEPPDRRAPGTDAGWQRNGWLRNQNGDTHPHTVRM